MKLFVRTHLLPAIVVAISCGLFACNKGSSGDPSTNDLGEFNPPGSLQTLTRSKKIVLTWVGANAEDSFQGYHVFGTTKTTAELKALAKFPTGVDVTSGASIPRCKDNSAFFEAFGLPAATNECETSVIVEDETTTASLLADETDTATEEAPKIANNLSCTGKGQTVEDKTLSLAAKDGQTLGRVFCDVEKAYDASSKELVALANGTTYNFIVVAVKGDEKNQVSWISNLASDTPAHTLYADVYEIATGAYLAFPIDFTGFKASDKVTGDCATDPNVCTLSNTNTKSLGASKSGLFLARANESSYKQRLYVSSSTGNANTKIKLQSRGPETWDDPTDDKTTILYQKPGDQAYTGTYADAGTKFSVFGNQVFDMQIDADGSAGTGTNLLYGKIVITDLSLATDTDTESKASVGVTIILQQKLNSVDYFQ